MKSSEEISLESEVLNLYLNEAKQTRTELEEEDDDDDDDDHDDDLLDEVELAADFLQKAGLSDLSKVYHHGEEITDVMVNASVRQNRLTEKQAQTVRSRVKTLNKTVKTIGNQPRRKQRQDVRHVEWMAEASNRRGMQSSGTTSDDSVDYTEYARKDVTDEHQSPSIPKIPTRNSRNMIPKGKLKWTNSETLHARFGQTDKGDVAHLDSDCVILKGYQSLNESATIHNRRERCGSDPITELVLDSASDATNTTTDSLRRRLSRSHSSVSTDNFLNDDRGISFEDLIRRDLQANSTDYLAVASDSICIDDLTDDQYRYLKPLLWVEVTALFDQYKISVVKRKSVSSKKKKGNVFGVNLSSLIMRDMPRSNEISSMVPQIFESIICHLNGRVAEDGILRIAGQQQKLNYLCSEVEQKFYNDRRHVEDVLKTAAVHDLTGVLKKLIRDLPDSIFTMELCDMFFKCGVIPNEQDKLKALNLLVLLLPVENRNTYRLLLRFCSNIIEHQAKNRMNLHNVAMITAPSFFTPRLLLSRESDDRKIKSLKSLTKEELQKQVKGAAICCCLMEEMIKNIDALWRVPSDLVRQAREAQQRARSRKDRDATKGPKLSCGKKMLQRSSTQYHHHRPSAMMGQQMSKEYFCV